jgi:hypothetical protein
MALVVAVVLVGFAGTQSMVVQEALVGIFKIKL